MLISTAVHILFRCVISPAQMHKPTSSKTLSWPFLARTARWWAQTARWTWHWIDQPWQCRRFLQPSASYLLCSVSLAGSFQSLGRLWSTEAVVSWLVERVVHWMPFDVRSAGHQKQRTCGDDGRPPTATSSSHQCPLLLRQKRSSWGTCAYLSNACASSVACDISGRKFPRNKNTWRTGKLVMSLGQDSR